MASNDIKKCHKEKIKTYNITKPGSNKGPNHVLSHGPKPTLKPKLQFIITLSTIKVQTATCQCTPMSIVRLISEARLTLLPVVRPCLKTTNPDSQVKAWVARLTRRAKTKHPLAEQGLANPTRLGRK